MILSRGEIARQVEAGNIVISPFCTDRLNPNSYNYSLGTRYRIAVPRKELRQERLAGDLCEIPAEGLELQPGYLYLAKTAEVIGSNRFVASLIGRSSVGRLGLFVQLAADLGNLGAAHCWTLELACTQPLTIYPGMIIGQVSFWEPEGTRINYQGRYTQHSDPTPSLDDLL
jgi:dCTP deaminase